MATEGVLKRAIEKLTHTNKMLKIKKKRCFSNKEADLINKQIKRNHSMILDYEYRLKNNLG